VRVCAGRARPPASNAPPLPPLLGPARRAALPPPPPAPRAAPRPPAAAPPRARARAAARSARWRRRGAASTASTAAPRPGEMQGGRHGWSRLFRRAPKRHAVLEHCQLPSQTSKAQPRPRPPPPPHLLGHVVCDEVLRQLLIGARLPRPLAPVAVLQGRRGEGGFCTRQVLGWPLDEWAPTPPSRIHGAGRLLSWTSPAARGLAAPCGSALRLSQPP
jgi:hypothetical protein